jgi:hypothetical protein
VASQVASVLSPRRSLTPHVSAAVLALTGLALGAIGLLLNARFAASFPQSAEAALILALTMTLLAASGVASRNIGDAVAGLGKTAD